MDSKWARVLLSYDTAIGVTGAIVIFMLAPEPSTALPLAILGGAVAIVAVLATIVTLLAVLLNADVMGPLVERLGGRDDVMFPYWFHGYLAAATIGTAIIAAVSSGTAARAFTAVAAGSLLWSAIAMIDLARHAMKLGRYRQSLEDSVKRYRERSA